MALSYKKLWKQLIDRDMTRTDLRHASGISTCTLAKLTKGEPVVTTVLERICRAIDCGIEDIVEIQPNTSRTSTQTKPRASAHNFNNHT